MAKPDFNQDNINAEIARLKKLPDNERKIASDPIKEDIVAWLLATFTFAKFYEERLAKWPRSMREETGFGIGTAIYYPEWTLKIIMPDNPEPSARPTKHEQSVSGSADPISGNYTVSKTHTWSW